MNLIDALLKVDKKSFKGETRKVEVPRLSKLMDKDFIVTIRSLTPSEENEISEQTFGFGRKNKVEMDSAKEKKLTILAGVVDFDFKDKKLHEHLGVRNSFEAIDKLLFPGEQDDLSEQIKEISGYGKNAVVEMKDEVKNS